MADEKTAPEVEAIQPEAPVVHSGPLPRPAGWIYKGYKVGKSEIWYASPLMQLIMVAFVCFLCPGMFNAVSGLGAAGQLDATVADNANVALNSTFAVVAFFSGTFANWLGIQLTLSLGGIGYCIYAASLLCYNHTQNDGFVIFAGALLGVCAGLLWSAQGAIMMSYPSEDKKGRYISYFWMIFNLGAVVGSLIPLGENINNKTGPVTDGTYAGFIVLMALGALLALVLVNGNKVIREDGSHVILMKHPTLISEAKGLWETLVGEPWIVLLFPMFFASNIFYTYQTSDMNAPHFDTRTRSLNSLLYWLAQIFGAVVFGFCLDFPGVRRTIRARAALGALFVVTMVVWGGGWAWQKKQGDRSVVEDPNYYHIDWEDGGELYIGPMFLYIFYGFFDAAWQSCIYWYMGALSNSGRKAANLAGFYKGIQSGAAAIFWRLDAQKTEYNVIFGATWGILGFSLLCAAPLIFLRIKDTVSLEEDLKFSDETVEDVAGADYLAAHAEKREEA